MVQSAKITLRLGSLIMVVVVLCFVVLELVHDAGTNLATMTFTPLFKVHQQDETGEVWLWCVLTRNNTRDFYHMAHAAQSVIPCWSWFEKMRRNLTTTRMMTYCGIWLTDTKILRLNPAGWTGQLIEHMGCIVSETEPPFYNTSAAENTNSTNRTIALFYTSPRNVLTGFQWFERPEDAKSLRRKVLESINFTETAPAQVDNIRGKGDSDAALRIAVVDRKSSRRLLNIENISRALHDAYPSATLEIGYMEDMEPQEQFSFWGRQDIVIAAHGAGLTNLFFLPPGNTSAIIEIFPLHFYDTTFFPSLRNSAGIRGYGYYNNETDLEGDWRNYSNTLRKRKYYRRQDLQPPVEAILELVRQAVFDGIRYGMNVPNPS